jgi:Zn finger protein HypA/HybF involved in hydrogenase expression
MKHKYTKEELEISVSKSLSIAQVCRELSIRPVGGNYKTINIMLKKNNININHFTGKGWNTGTRYKTFSKKQSLSEILVENSTYSNTNSLRKRLIKENIKEYKCERCENTIWLNQPIKLELNHINGNNMDNRIENLEILCPNCHSMTSNFRSKNKLSALSEKRDVEYRKFREDLTVNPEPSSIKNREGAETLHDIPKSVKTKKCLHCNNDFIFSRNESKYCSTECYREHSRTNIPKVPDLLKSFEIYGSFVQVGKHYNVSDKAVHKWCELYGITDMVKRKSRPQTL